MLYYAGKLAYNITTGQPAWYRTLEAIKERWNGDFTEKSALTALNEFAARTVNMAGNHKVKLSKYTTSALAYCLCLSLLLSSDDVERNPGPEWKFQAEYGQRPENLLNETWLDSSISGSKIQLHGYSLVRRDKTRRKGGVLIYVSSKLDYKVIQQFENDQPDLQCLWMEITPPKTKGFIFCSCYRPPDVDNEAA